MSGFFITFNIVFTVLGFLVSAGVPLLILFVVRRMFFGHLTPAAASAQTPRRRHWLWLGLIPLAGIALFIGLMVASIGGALPGTRR